MHDFTGGEVKSLWMRCDHNRCGHEYMFSWSLPDIRSEEDYTISILRMLRERNSGTGHLSFVGVYHGLIEGGP